ncbi:MAG: tetratricopeptide repeat protein [Roseibacillus sp.]|nr:tetratricopeptide repeat protein [Roseibacillus sp.]
MTLIQLAGINLSPAQAPGIIAPPGTDSELYHRANRYYGYAEDSRDLDDKRRAYRMSIPLFREYLSQRPREELVQQASYKLSMALLLTGDRDGAEQGFSSVIQRFRRGTWVALSAYRLAAQLYNRQDWSGAVPYFKVAAREATKDELAHKSIFYESRCLQMAGKTEEAITRLGDIVKNNSNPYRDYARLAMGELHARAGRHEQALEAFEALLVPSVAPQERAQALVAAGVSASKLGQEAKARGFLDSTISSTGIQPKYKSRAQLALMQMSFASEQYEQAVKAFDAGEYPGERSVLANIYLIAGRSFVALDRHQEAIAQFFNSERLALSVKPEPLRKIGFEASYRRLNCFYSINGANIPTQVDAFAEAYEEENLGSPWLHKALLMKAETLFHEADVSRAATAYNEVNPSALPVEMRADVYFKRGWCLADTGEYGRAAQNLSSFLATFPDHERFSEALAKRAHAYIKIGDRKSALKDLQILLERTPESDLASFAHQYCGKIHRDEQRWPEMIVSYQNLLALPGAEIDQKSRADAQYWMGWGYYKQQKWKKAITHFKEARVLLPARYREPAGVHIVLAAYSLLDSDQLKEGVDQLLSDAPHQQFPARMLTWLGLERFSKGDYDGANRFLGLATTPEAPTQTDTLVWRHLAKARLETRDFEGAAAALEILLSLDQEDFWKADALLDKSHALIGLQKWEEAQSSAGGGITLNPSGTVQAGLYLAIGDIGMHRMDYETAAANYLKASKLFIDDREIKPLGLLRAAEALEKGGQLERATQIRKQLREEFPSWKSPES